MHRTTLIARLSPPLLVLLGVVGLIKWTSAHGEPSADRPKSDDVMTAQFLFDGPPVPKTAGRANSHAEQPHGTLRRLPPITDERQPETGVDEFIGPPAEGGAGDLAQFGVPYQNTQNTPVDDLLTHTVGSPSSQPEEDTAQDATGPDDEHVITPPPIESSVVEQPGIATGSAEAPAIRLPAIEEPAMADAKGHHSAEGAAAEIGRADIPTDTAPDLAVNTKVDDQEDTESYYRLPPTPPAASDAARPVPQVLVSPQQAGAAEDGSSFAAPADSAPTTVLPALTPPNSEATPALSGPATSNALSGEESTAANEQPPVDAQRGSAFRLIDEPAPTAASGDYVRLPSVVSPSDSAPSASRLSGSVANTVGDDQHPVTHPAAAGSIQPPVQRPVAMPRPSVSIGSGLDDASPTLSPRRSLPVVMSPRKRPSVAARQSSQLIAHGFTLANRGALFAAKSEFLQALSLIAEERDAQNGNNDCATALGEAWRALSEADEFLPKNSRGVFNRDVKQIVERHRTPVLHNKNLTGVNAIVALQHYYTYARNQLARAVHGEPEASRALFALGKVHMLFPKQAPNERRRNGQKAVAFHQAALMVDEQNYLAANELGVLLARASQHEFAKEVFLKSLMVRPRVETWHNLAAVHKSLGEMDLRQRALFEKERLVAQRRPTQAPSNEAERSGVNWVSPAEFVRSNPEQPQRPARSVRQPPVVPNNASRLPTAATPVPRSVGLPGARSANRAAPWTQR